MHFILPVSPDVAIVLCNELRCSNSSAAHVTHTSKVPNSLLTKAPHLDIVNVNVSSAKKGKKRWPATTAWRVNIGALSADHHRVITSYSLSHAKSIIVCRRRKCFEKAKRDLLAFSKDRVEAWKSQEFRFEDRNVHRQRGSDSSPSQDQLTSIAELQIEALDDIFRNVIPKREHLQRTKENFCKSWLALRAANAFLKDPTLTAAPIKAAFEAAYPAQPPDHRDLITIDFNQFFLCGIGDDTFTKLSLLIDKKIKEVVQSEDFEPHWTACRSDTNSVKDSLPLMEDYDDPRNHDEKHNNPAFRPFFRAAQCYEVMKWLFEHRQDILADFVRQIAVPLHDLQTQVFRFRPTRE